MASISFRPRAHVLARTLLRQSTTTTPFASTLRYSSSAASSSDPVMREVAAAEQKPKAVAEHRPEGSAVAAAVVSGAPEELAIRPVRIYRPSPTTMQSPKATSHHWRVDWDTLQGAGRWENPLMGWASSADYMQGTHVKFNTKDDAITFCEKQGWPYYVQEPHPQKFRPKSYSDNFLYNPGKLRLVRTK